MEGKEGEFFISISAFGLDNQVLASIVTRA